MYFVLIIVNVFKAVLFKTTNIISINEQLIKYLFFDKYKNMYQILYHEEEDCINEKFKIVETDR